MKASFPTLPNSSFRIVRRSSARESNVASSGKVVLYLCMSLRARKRASFSVGTNESYLEKMYYQSGG